MRLSELFPTLDVSAREALAKRAGISVGYLWQIATRWRDKTPSIHVIAALVAADPRLTTVELVAEFSEIDSGRSSMPESTSPRQGPPESAPADTSDILTKQGQAVIESLDKKKDDSGGDA